MSACHALLLALLAVPAPAAPHPDSVSRSLARVVPGRAEVELRFQTASLLEVLPALDGDGDARLTAEELEAARPAVADYLATRWQLLLPPFRAEDALPGRLAELVFARDLRDLDQTYQWVDARLEWTTDASLEDVVVHSELFTERDPYHRDFLVWTYADEAPWNTLFRFGEHRWRFRAAALRAPEVRREGVVAGARAAVREPVLWLFLVALACAVAGGRKGVVVVGVVGASAAAGALAGMLGPAPPPRVAELALPLTLAYLGAEGLARRAQRTPWVEATLFGVVVGMVLAQRSAEDWELEPLVAQAALGFTAALAGLLVGAGVLLLALARLLPGARRAEPPTRGWAPRWALLATATVATLAGLALFVLRTGWLD